MQIDIKEIVKGDKWLNQILWICDYRRPDLNKKPIRSLEPTKAILLSNENLVAKKKIYYTENHFVKLNAKNLPSSTIIAPYDNTGYRSFTGVPINVFDNEEECVEFYNKQVDLVIKEIDEKINSIVVQLNAEREELVKRKSLNF